MPARTIAELVSLTGVPPATVHYYLRQGLLPKPRQAAPNRFVWDDRHVQALRLIRMLRDQRGLSLPMIRRILPELLALEEEEAFRPELWDRALGPRIEQGRLPGARLLAAAKREFAKRGLAEVGVDDLTRAARIAKGSFYRHYRSKEELFVAAAESFVADAVASFRERAGAGLAPEEAGPVLAEALRPGMPLVLELVARSMQDRPGYALALHRVLGTALPAIGEAVAGPGTAQERGGRAFGEAVAASAVRWPGSAGAGGAQRAR